MDPLEFVVSFDVVGHSGNYHANHATTSDYSLVTLLISDGQRTGTSGDGLKRFL